MFSLLVSYLNTYFISGSIRRIVTIAPANGIHNGANTHHQDQLITPISFKTINTIVNKPSSVTPPASLVLDSAIIV